MLPTAGWLPDPLGDDCLRWWDGSAWTDHVIPLEAPEVPPKHTDLDEHREELHRSAAYAGRWAAAATAPLNDASGRQQGLPSTTTKGILLFVLCPAVVPLALVAVSQFSGLGGPTTTTASATATASLVLAVLGTLLSARMDRRELRQLRFRVAPSALWSLLPLGYPVVRTVRLRRAGAPAGAAVIGALLVALTAGGSTALMMAGSGSSPNGSVVRQLVTSSLQERITEQLALLGQVYDNVRCPSAPTSLSYGTSFQCTATDATGAPTTLNIVVDDKLQLSITAN